MNFLFGCWKQIQLIQFIYCYITVDHWLYGTWLDELKKICCKVHNTNVKINKNTYVRRVICNETLVTKISSGFGLDSKTSWVQISLLKNVYKINATSTRRISYATTSILRIPLNENWLGGFLWHAACYFQSPLASPHIYPVAVSLCRVLWCWLPVTRLCCKFFLECGVMAEKKTKKSLTANPCVVLIRYTYWTVLNLLYCESFKFYLFRVSCELHFTVISIDCAVNILEFRLLAVKWQKNTILA